MNLYIHDCDPVAILYMFIQVHNRSSPNLADANVALKRVVDLLINLLLLLIRVDLDAARVTLLVTEDFATSKVVLQRICFLWSGVSVYGGGLGTRRNSPFETLPEISLSSTSLSSLAASWLE